jgi:phosphatidylglycerophosphate synthase
MYAPFSLIRKIVFSMVVCIQPSKPISSLALLLIFTILIMVCLFFYEPFENRRTDLVSIGLEVALIAHVTLIIMFGLNAMDGVAARNLGIATSVMTVIPGFASLGWVIFLTVDGVTKCKK